MLWCTCEQADAVAYMPQRLTTAGHAEEQSGPLWSETRGFVQPYCAMTDLMLRSVNQLAADQMALAWSIMRGVFVNQAGVI